MKNLIERAAQYRFLPMKKIIQKIANFRRVGLIILTLGSFNSACDKSHLLQNPRVPWSLNNPIVFNSDSPPLQLTHFINKNPTPIFQNGSSLNFKSINLDTYLKVTSKCGLTADNKPHKFSKTYSSSNLESIYLHDHVNVDFKLELLDPEGQKKQDVFYCDFEFWGDHKNQIHYIDLLKNSKLQKHKLSFQLGPRVDQVFVNEAGQLQAEFLSSKKEKFNFRHYKYDLQCYYDSLSSVSYSTESDHILSFKFEQKNNSILDQCFFSFKKEKAGPSLYSQSFKVVEESPELESYILFSFRRNALQTLENFKNNKAISIPFVLINNSSQEFEFKANNFDFNAYAFVMSSNARNSDQALFYNLSFKTRIRKNPSHFKDKYPKNYFPFVFEVPPLQKCLLENTSFKKSSLKSLEIEEQYFLRLFFPKSKTNLDVVRNINGKSTHAWMNLFKTFELNLKDSLGSVSMTSQVFNDFFHFDIALTQKNVDYLIRNSQNAYKELPNQTYLKSQFDNFAKYHPYMIQLPALESINCGETRL